MDTEAQIQAIVDKLVGAPAETLPPPAAFDEPWRSIFLRVGRATSAADAAARIRKAVAGLDPAALRPAIQDAADLAPLIRQLQDRLPPDDAFTPFPSLHDISGRFPPVDWLWPSWIPRGMLTLLGAAPGAGKSLVALDLARRIIHGEPFPDGTPVPCPGANVLIIDAEGTPALLNQRAQAWDIDRRRLFLMLVPNARGLIDLADPGQQLQLCDMVRELRPALVVVDSLAAATTRGETSLEGARAVLGSLSAIAHRAHLALLVIHHLRKPHRSSGPLLAAKVVADDLRGSSFLSAAARSVLALSVLATAPASPLPPQPIPAPPATSTLLPGTAVLSPEPHPPSSPSCPSWIPSDESSPVHPPSSTLHPPSSTVHPPSSTVHPPSSTPHPRPDLEGPRRLEVVKANLCRLPPPLGLIFEGENVPVPTLRYTPLAEPSPQPAYVDLCAHWLFQFLAEAGGPVKPADVVREAAEAGFPRRTLYRARQALAGFVVDLGSSPRDPNKRWILVTAPSPPGPTAESGASQTAPLAQDG